MASAAIRREADVPHESGIPLIRDPGPGSAAASATPRRVRPSSRRRLQLWLILASSTLAAGCGSHAGGAAITVEVGGQAVAATNAQVEDLFIVGLGDSFGSGEGNPDVPVRLSAERSADYGIRSKDQEPLSGYPARAGDWKAIGDRAFIEENPRWLDQACHRSLYSHQLRAALQLGVFARQRMFRVWLQSTARSNW